MAEYTADIQHLPGVEKVVDDALSRLLVVAAVEPPTSTGLLDWAQLAAVQSTCEDLAALCARRPHHLLAVQVEGFPVWCDISTGVWRPVVPQGFRQQVFDTIHGLVHLGICATWSRLEWRRSLYLGFSSPTCMWIWWALSQPAGMGKLTC